MGPREFGKELTYLLSVLAQVMQPSAYAALPLGCGTAKLLFLQSPTRHSDYMVTGQ